MYVPCVLKCTSPRFTSVNNSWRVKLNYKPHYITQPINTHLDAKIHCYNYPINTESTMEFPLKTLNLNLDKVIMN